MTNYRIVHIRPIDESQIYSITECEGNTVIVRRANDTAHLVKESTIVISRKDWNLYVGSALLVGFDAVKHYHRAYLNTLRWRWGTMAQVEFSARGANKNRFKQMLEQRWFTDDNIDALRYPIQIKPNP